MRDDIAIRAAEPEDVDAAVPLIYSSGPAAFDYVLMHAARGGAADYLRRAFVDGAGEFGHRCHVVATQGGQVVGIGAGYGGETAVPFFFAALRQILAYYRLAAPGVIARGLQMERLIPPPSARDLFYLAHLGVRPELRSRGIGVLLSRYLMERGVRAGYRRAALDVSIGNPRAQALYERLGFAVTGQRASSLSNRYATVLDHRRMECALHAAGAPTVAA